MNLKTIVLAIAGCVAFISAAYAQPVTTQPALNMLTANCTAAHVLIGGAVSPGCGPTPTRAGDIFYYNGTSIVSFPGNNSGTQAFTENSSGVPAWATLTGSGTVTSVVCGTGLTGGTITTSGTCALSTPVSTANGGVFQGACTTYTPTVTITGGTGTSSSGAVGASCQNGKLLYVRAAAVINYSGTPTGVSYSLPAGTTAISSQVQNVNASNATASLLLEGIIATSGASVILTSAAGATPVTSTGQTLEVNGTIEIQ